MAKFLGIFGKYNQEKNIEYRDGKYYFTESGEEVPEQLQAGLKTTVFKQRGNLNNGPYDMTQLMKLKTQVQQELKAGNLKKENHSRIRCT